MKLAPIVTSLLENDLYKFSMGQAIHHQFPEYETTWDFCCRNRDVFYTPEMVEEIKEQVKAYCELRFKDEELDYLAKIPWIKKDYIDFLRIWRPRYEDFTITATGIHGLECSPEGRWLYTSMYEMPFLMIANEVYFRMKYDYNVLLNTFKERLDEKFDALKHCKYYAAEFSEFGLRRRLSREAQAMAVEKFAHLNDTMHSNSVFVGTSNVRMAKEYGIRPVGTMAHEWAMCVGQGNPKHNPAYSNWYMLDAWVKEYGILNGIALTDTITTDAFCRDFKQTYATLFSGVRHDSGDPFAWGEKMIRQYESLGIDPKQKTLLFSDSLNFQKTTDIFYHFRGRAKTAFGIGTYLSNDTCVEPLNIVMKPVKCNGRDIAKLSDAEGKCMCRNPEYVDYLRRTIDWRLKYES